MRFAKRWEGLEPLTEHDAETTTPFGKAQADVDNREHAARQIEMSRPEVTERLTCIAADFPGKRRKRCYTSAIFRAAQRGRRRQVRTGWLPVRWITPRRKL